MTEDLLEDGAGGDIPHKERVMLSIAISLKRIADTMDGTASGLCITETLIGGAKS